MASLVFLISLPLIDALNTESPKRGLPDPNRAGLAYFTNATFDPVNKRTKTARFAQYNMHIMPDMQKVFTS